MHQVTIVGGGFAGLRAAQQLNGAAVEVTLVDRRNHHLFQPLLYQVATGALSPANISAPLRNILRRQKNIRVVLDEVQGFDVARRRVRLTHGELPYDTLVLAAGSTHSYFGRADWAAHAPGLKTIEDATEIRSRLLLAFEEAERAGPDEATAMLTTFVIVGGGPTGVEMAGAVAEIAHHTLRGEFRRIDPANARVVLVEMSDRVLSGYPEDLSHQAEKSLRRLGVELHLNSRVVEIGTDEVQIEHAERRQRIAARNTFWAAGVQASPLAQRLAEAIQDAAAAAGSADDRRPPLELDRAGRLRVEPDLTVPGRPEIFVIGDLARCLDEEGQPLPAVAPVAMQQGQYAARQIVARLRGRSDNASPSPQFRYRDYGLMATIGRRMAVAQLRGWKFSGSIAWLLWLFIHLMQLVEFQHRLLVLIQWAWHYVTLNRAARLITGEEKLGR